MTDAELSAVINRSTRARDLLATMIQCAVSEIFDYNIEPSTARDLARVHSLDSAISEIGKKLRTHREIEDKTAASRLAITEVVLTPNGTQNTIATAEAIIAVRKETLDALEKSRQADGELTKDLEQVRTIRAEIVERGARWKRFMNEYSALWITRRQELRDLELPSDEFRHALSELEAIFVRYGRTFFAENRPSISPDE